MRDLVVLPLALALALALAGAAVAAPGPFRTPHAAVAALYANNGIPTSPAEVRRFYTADLASAILDDINDGVGYTNDADYRYDAQDMTITRFRIRDQSVGPKTAVVRAYFNNFGKPYRVSYDLCLHRPGAWLISNVSPPSSDLRTRLKLKRTEACR